MKTMTVSELIETISTAKTSEKNPDAYRFEQHWINCLKGDLYSGGFREDDWDEDCDTSLDGVLSGAFSHILRQLHAVAPVLINEDPDEIEDTP